MSEDHFETAVATAKDTAGQVTTAFMLREVSKSKFSFIKPFEFGRDMLALMIFFDASSYSRRTYARVRSSMALERFVSSLHAMSRTASLRWARAWLLVVQIPDSEKHLAALASSIGMNDRSLNFEAGHRSIAREDCLDQRRCHTSE